MPGRAKPNKSGIIPLPSPMDPGLNNTTLTLLRLAAEGDRAATDRLFARYAPALQRWARGRLPRWARDIADTNDLVQETLLQTFRNLDHFQYRGEGALHAYLRQGVMNRIREELRRHNRRPAHGALESGMEADQVSPLESAIGGEAIERYEAALTTLKPDEREAVIARMELGLTHQEIAEALGKPSTDAARMMVARALVQLARAMNRP
jgi:RNA polymerase sigma factor (sigma-70 family)